MHRPAPRTWAVFAVLTLVASTLGFALAGGVTERGPDADGAASAARTRSVGGDGGLAPIGFDPLRTPTVAHTPPFPLEDGRIPTKSEALDFAKRYARFLAKGSEGLDDLARAGHLSGSGTPKDPYVLERFYVDGDLTIQSTDRALILREGYVDGQLSLNYIGEEVYVHHVYAKDLRVNENVVRSGHNTGGLFHDNHFGFVGQIRHFVGAFHDNEIGPVPDGIVRTYLSDTGASELPAGIVFNFDGFHGADVHHNRFHGMVDIKLHGHNHGDCFVCPIHDHADPDQLAFDEAAAAARADHDGTHAHDTDGDATADLLDALGFRTRHSIRYHTLLFRENEIRVPDGSAFALRYNDDAHAGDDRTANSEPSHFLDDPHVHYQDITIRDNFLAGGPFRLAVFNAPDDRHVVQNQGILRIEGNTIEQGYTRTTDRDPPPRHGLVLQGADGIELRLVDNTVRFLERSDGLPAGTLRSVVDHAPALVGFHLQDFASGNVTIAGNHVNAGDVAVLVARLAPDVRWVLGTNDFRTATAWRAGADAHGPDGGGDA